MTSSPGWQDWVRSADPVAARVVVVGFFAALSYGAVLVTQGVVHQEGSSTLRAVTDDYVVVVTGGDPVDGLVARSLGNATLTVPRAGSLEPLIADVVRLSPNRVLILGGPDAVDEAAAAALTARAPASVTRLAGPDRYATAARAALSTFRTPVDEVLIARSDPTDATGAAGQGLPLPVGPCLPPGPPCGADLPRPLHDGTPVLLVTGDGVPLATTSALQQLRPKRLTVVGAVSDAVMDELQTHVRGELARTPAPSAGAA